MRTVRMYHPDLDRWHEFPETAQQQMHKSGWLREAPVPMPEPGDETTADTGGEEKRPRRRRNHDEES